MAADNSRAGGLGLHRVVPVGLVDHHDVGKLEHTLLDAQQLVAGARPGHLIDQGHRVAVLAVDPSSTRTGRIDSRR